MSTFCFRCNSEVHLIEGRAGRLEACPNCKSDIHVCLNCKFHDKSAYNECRESQAERVLVKDRSNYCDYFKFRDGPAEAAKNEKDQIMKKLDDIFKK